jgi:hypothetical protein
VQPRTHAVASLGRGGQRWWRVERKAADARERIADDLRLELKLPVVRRHARTHCRRIANRQPPRVGQGNADNTSVVSANRNAFARSLDTRPHAFTWYRSPDEHDLAVVPRQHTAAGGRFLYV